MLKDDIIGSAKRSALKRYKRNCSLPAIPQGVTINGQGKCCVSGHRLGIMKMSFNGCGPIAIYNAMLLAGHKTDFNLLTLCVDSNALRMGGIFGTDWNKLDKVFSICHIAAIKAADYNDFTKVLPSVSSGIICYWAAKPGRSVQHYAAVAKTDSGYIVCNRYSNRDKPSKVPNLEKLCTEDRFIAGYFIN